MESEPEPFRWDTLDGTQPQVWRTVLELILGPMWHMSIHRAGIISSALWVQCLHHQNRPVSETLKCDLQLFMAGGV